MNAFKGEEMTPRAGWYLNVETNKMKYWDGDNWKKMDEDETPPAPTATPIAHHAELSHTAVVAFVLSLIFPVVGWVLGIRSRREIRESNGSKTGAAYAVAATWIGAIGTAIWVFILSAMLAMGGHHHGFGDHLRFGDRAMNGRGSSISQNAPDNSGFGGYGMMGGSLSFGSGNQDPTNQGLTNQDPNSGVNPGNGGFGMMSGNGSQGGQGLSQGQSNTNK